MTLVRNKHFQLPNGEVALVGESTRLPVKRMGESGHVEETYEYYCYVIYNDTYYVFPPTSEQGGAMNIGILANKLSRMTSFPQDLEELSEVSYSLEEIGL